MKNCIISKLFKIGIIISLALNYISCSKYATVPVISIGAIVLEKVTDGVIGKTIFDPIWEYFFGGKNTGEFSSSKGEIISTISDNILESIMPSVHAGDSEFQCNSNETEYDCRNRVASVVEYRVDIYASNFVSAFGKCRDKIALSIDTGRLDYVKQVDLITDCISNAGFSKEVNIIKQQIKKSGE